MIAAKTDVKMMPTICMGISWRKPKAAPGYRGAPFGVGVEG
jgi:hypothetical protein